jgi:hydroxylaminobenzene mutase
MESIIIKKQANRLIFLGLFLFFLGLVIGLFVQNMANPRMALSAHLQGITNGIFLIVLGLIWQKLKLSKNWLIINFWLTIFGTFANLIAVFIAARTGMGKMMPIAGGQEGDGLVEGIISFLLIALSLSMLTVCVLAMIGFGRYIQEQDTISTE